MSADAVIAETSKWHDIDWDAIFEGRGTADHYFARPGLIRKDRLAQFVPSEHHPHTVVVKTFEELQGAVRDLNSKSKCRAGPPCGQKVCFVLKKAHSSNASGIRFLSGRDAALLLSCSYWKPWVHFFTPVAATVVVAATLTAVSATSRLDKHIIQIFGRMSCQRKGPAVAVGAAAIAAGLAALGGQTMSRRSIKQELQCVFSATSPDGQNNAKNKETWLLQRNVEPWLYQGFKFHLRALLLCVGDLAAYVYEDVRLLRATEPYEAPCCNGTRTFAHITNMGASGQHAAYSEAEQNLSLQVLGPEMTTQIFAATVEVLGETLTRVRAAGRRQLFALPNCWELFGADLLVEAVTGRVVLLELNPRPSMAMYGKGPGVRERVLGSHPLERVPPSWRPVPLNIPSS